MDKLIFLPMLVSAGMLLAKEPREVFILVFLPSLTLLPTYFDTKLVSGIPEMSFWAAALLPILGAWAFQNFAGYRFHWMDLVVVSYVLIVFFAQWQNSTYKEAQKILYNNMMAIFVPYLLVRTFCRDRQTLIDLIRMMTLLGAFIAVFNIIELRMFDSYFDKILRNIWPRYVMWDVGMVMSRWGFKRAFGPFSHPIVAGYFFAMVAPLAIWCYREKIYPSPRIGKIVVILNVMGIFASISRAPILGFFMGLVITYYGWSHHKAAVLSVIAVAAAIVMMMLLPKAIEYAAVTRASAETTDQRNVAYRKEMWAAYYEVVMERPYMGWGRFTVPSVKGMDSIDSEYLGVALASGLAALACYLIFLFGTLLRLVGYVLPCPPDDPWGRLGWCLVAGWATAIFTQMTVYSGAQSVQYLFMLGGVSQVLILEDLENLPGAEKTKILKPAFVGHGFAFNRTL